MTVYDWALVVVIWLILAFIFFTLDGGPAPRADRIDLPRLYLQGYDQAHQLTLGEAMAEHQLTLGEAMADIGRAFSEAFAPWDDLLAETRPLTLRERLEFRVWETWYAIRALFR
jgi:hypothetical protein